MDTRLLSEAVVTESLIHSSSGFLLNICRHHTLASIPHAVSGMIQKFQLSMQTLTFCILAISLKISLNASHATYS